MVRKLKKVKKINENFNKFKIFTAKQNRIGTLWWGLACQMARWESCSESIFHNWRGFVVPRDWNLSNCANASWEYSWIHCSRHKRWKSFAWEKLWKALLTILNLLRHWQLDTNAADNRLPWARVTSRLPAREQFEPTNAENSRNGSSFWLGTSSHRNLWNSGKACNCPQRHQVKEYFDETKWATFLCHCWLRSSRKVQFWIRRSSNCSKHSCWN